MSLKKHTLLNKAKSILSVLLLLTLITVFLPSCGKKADIIPENINELTKENSSVSFNNLCNEIFKNELSSNALSLHYTVVSPQSFDISDYSLSIGHYTTQAAALAVNTANTYLSRLKLIPYDSLNDEDKITYDIILWYLNNNISLSQFTYYDEPLSQTIGIQTQLPILFSEYKFREKKDIDEYLKLLEQIGTYFDEICQYEKEKSAKGMFMADFSAKRVINSCNAFLSDKENHYLIKSFEEKLNSLQANLTNEGNLNSSQTNFTNEEKLNSSQTNFTEDEKSQYIARNKEILQNNVFPAYEKLINTLNELIGTGKNTAGLCGFENGRNYYEALLKSTVCSNKTIDEYISMVDANLNSDLTKLAKLIEADKSALENLENITITETEPQKILETLQTKMTADFPEGISCTYNLKEISKNLQSVYSPAFYLTPPIDSANENTIYINPAYNNDSMSLYSTLAHEGFPGHMYQNLYSSANQSNLVRNIFNFQGYSEGYATYAENLSYKYLELDETIKNIYAISQSISLGIYARLDLAIHGEGYSLNQTKDFLTQYGITDDNAALEIFQSIVEQPANYMSYYGGYLEFLELKNTAEEKAGDNFSIKEFHNYILSMGEAPFDILRKYL